MTVTSATAAPAVPAANNTLEFTRIACAQGGEKTLRSMGPLFKDGQCFDVPSTTASGFIKQMHLDQPTGTLKMPSGPLKGKSYLLPFYYSQAQSLSLVTVADRDAVAKEISAEGFGNPALKSNDVKIKLTPIEKHPLYPALLAQATTPEAKAALKNKVIVSIYADDVRQSTLGQFAPSFLGFWIDNPTHANGTVVRPQPTPQSGDMVAGPDGKPAVDANRSALWVSSGMYITNTVDAEAFGIFAWRFPKRLGDTNPTFSGTSKEFTSAYAGNEIMHLKLSDSSKLAAAGNLSQSLNLVTPKTFGASTINHGAYNFDLSLGAFNPSADTFYINPATPTGKVMTNIGVIDSSGHLAKGQPAEWLFLDHLVYTQDTDKSQLPSPNVPCDAAR